MNWKPLRQEDFVPNTDAPFIDGKEYLFFAKNALAGEKIYHCWYLARHFVVRGYLTNNLSRSDVYAMFTHYLEIETPTISASPV